MAIQDYSQTADPFLADVLNGLASEQKSLPSKYFYDKRGSELFDQICKLDEYYPTRTEIEIMRRHATQLAETIDNAGLLIELGSGSSVKTDYLLDNVRNIDTYVPVDISAEHLAQVCDGLRERHSELVIAPLATDFTRLDRLPDSLHQTRRPHHVYFPGSTIGNFELAEVVQLLANIAGLIGESGSLLLGVDLIKDVDVLLAAYNDAKGVTAQFNQNVLQRINRELDGDFDTSEFRHKSVWNNEADRIEMHLFSNCDQEVRISHDTIRFAEGESICTEYSHKYDRNSLERMAASANLWVTDCWTDQRDWFAVMRRETAVDK